MTDPTSVSSPLIGGIGGGRRVGRGRAAGGNRPDILVIQASELVLSFYSRRSIMIVAT